MCLSSLLGYTPPLYPSRPTLTSGGRQKVISSKISFWQVGFPKSYRQIVKASDAPLNGLALNGLLHSRNTFFSISCCHGNHGAQLTQIVRKLKYFRVCILVQTGEEGI